MEGGGEGGGGKRGEGVGGGLGGEIMGGKKRKSSMAVNEGKISSIRITLNRVFSIRDPSPANGVSYHLKIHRFLST